MLTKFFTLYSFKTGNIVPQLLLLILMTDRKCGRSEDQVQICQSPDSLPPQLQIFDACQNEELLFEQVQPLAPLGGGCCLITQVLLQLPDG